MTRAEEIAERLRSAGNEKTLAIMAKSGIATAHAAGVPMRVVRGIAMQIHRDHALALELWDTGLHEARILATIVADPARVPDALLEKWGADCNSFDLTDHCCQNLFWRTAYAWTKAEEWSDRPEELVKRAAFVLQAVLTLRRKDADEAQFLSFLPLIRREAADPRKHVRTGISWALRNAGRVSPTLRTACRELAEELAAHDAGPARTIGRQALRAFAKLPPREDQPAG